MKGNEASKSERRVRVGEGDAQRTHQNGSCLRDLSHFLVSLHELLDPRGYGILLGPHVACWPLSRFPSASFEPALVFRSEETTTQLTLAKRSAKEVRSVKSLRPDRRRVSTDVNDSTVAAAVLLRARDYEPSLRISS